MKKILFLLLAGICTLTGKAQHSYMSAPGVAVFYPAKYDASAHAPSPIFERELYPIGEVPADWKIRPVYSQAGNEQVVTLQVGEDVDPDAEGKAVGTLYEDARDGFEYRDGHFARYELKAETIGKQVNVSIRKVEGKDEAKPRVLRVGYVTDQKITYSPWTSGESVTMKVVKDKTDTLVLKGLKFVEPGKE